MAVLQVMVNGQKHNSKDITRMMQGMHYRLDQHEMRIGRHEDVVVMELQEIEQQLDEHLLASRGPQTADGRT